MYSFIFSLRVLKVKQLFDDQCLLKHYREVYERLEFVHKKVFPDAHRRRWKQADWTDETDQMILILQSIIHSKALVGFLQNLKKKFSNNIFLTGFLCENVVDTH